MFREQLAPYFTKGKTYAVMGVGSVLRNDDGAGMHFADCVERLTAGTGLTVVKGGTAPENFTGVIKAAEPDVLFIADAAYMNQPVGTVQVLGSEHIGGMGCSTHMLPLSLTLDYLKMECGCRGVVIGIQAQNTEQGLDMCPAVKRAAETAAAVVAELYAGNV